MNESPEQHSQLKGLVLAAFAIAAKDRQTEWHRMRGSVLKNRLLDLTNRRFDEADYGADRFGTLVERLDGLLVIDHSAKPFIVELCEPYRSEIDLAEQAHQSRSKGTIRSDLWNAIMDYSGVGEWVWDRSSGMAVPADEAVDGNAGDLLPTLDRPTLQAWRTGFFEEHSPGLQGQEALELEDWARKGLGTAALPMRLRGLWNARMREQVWERLLQFFQTHELEPPVDAFVSKRSREPADELRSFILRCIAIMSEQELRGLTIPADIAMRAHR